jgi:hypothetical protein
MRKYNHKLINNSANRADTINIIIRVANLADAPKELIFREEPTIMENLGLTIRMIRKKNNLDFQNLAARSGCLPEIIIALEMGILPIKEISLYLPSIFRGLGLDQNFIEEILQSFREGRNR